MPGYTPPTQNVLKPQNKNDDPVRISEIMKQISKATGQIDKIQLKTNSRSRQRDDSDEEEFDFGNAGGRKNEADEGNFKYNRDASEEGQNDLLDSGISTGNNTNRKNRNNWAVKKDQ